jgi:formate dehydrogenase iron-sulfur subunit
MLACPFHIPRYEWDEPVPFVKKCTLCFQRLSEGKIPACVEACPNEALTFGDRSHLLAEAHRRLASSGNQYIPRVWGEEELGGTSVLYLSDVDLGVMGWPGQESEAIPHLTEPLIAKTPTIGISVLGSLLGINWVIRRRMRLAAEATGGEEPISRTGLEDAADRERKEEE